MYDPTALNRCDKLPKLSTGVKFSLRISSHLFRKAIFMLSKLSQAPARRALIWLISKDRHMVNSPLKLHKAASFSCFLYLFFGINLAFLKIGFITLFCYFCWDQLNYPYNFIIPLLPWQNIWYQDMRDSNLGTSKTSIFHVTVDFPCPRTAGGKVTLPFCETPCEVDKNSQQNPTNKNSQEFRWELIKTHQTSNQQKPW